MSDKITIEDIFNSGKKKDRKGITKWNFGDTLKEFIAQDSANKLDSREQTLSIELSDEIKQTLKLSRWKRLRKRLGKELSRAGKAAVVVDIINGAPFVSLGNLDNFTRVGGVLHEVLLYTEETVLVDETNYPIYERFYLEGGVPKKMYAINIENEWIEQGEIVTYPANITRIPVKVFDNNEESKSDIANTKMMSAIAQLGDFSDKLGETFELSQFGLIVNRNMTGGKTGKQLLDELAKNKVIEVNGMDSQLGAGIQPTGSQGFIGELTALIDYLEDKIMKYTFTTRDTTSSGTNKHNAEVGMFNQFAIEYLIDKKEIREEDYADFYSILGLFYGEDLTTITVELQISEVLQNMLDAMKPMEIQAPVAKEGE